MFMNQIEMNLNTIIDQVDINSKDVGTNEQINHKLIHKLKKEKRKKKEAKRVCKAEPPGPVG